MKKILLVLMLAAGCSTEHPAPTAPTTAKIETPIRTSRVNPKDFDPDELAGLTLEHDPFAPGVQMCHTMQREYCSPDGDRCWWETDYFTVMAPVVCPIDPIP